jgi:hypothetical protein
MDTIETQNSDPQSVEPAQENIKVADVPWYFINGDTSSTCEDI